MVLRVRFILDWISVTETSVPLVLAAQELLPEGSVASEKPYSRHAVKIENDCTQNK